MPNTPTPELVDAFRRLGMSDPEGWADSQVNEGFNHLSTAKFLYWLFDGVVRTANGGDLTIQTTINYHEKLEREQPGKGEALCPAGSVFRRMLGAGFTERDIRSVMRDAQVRALTDVCGILDDCGTPPDDAAPCRFGVFELDAEGNPLGRVNGLHECVFEFDAEQQEQLKSLASDKAD